MEVTLENSPPLIFSDPLPSIFAELTGGRYDVRLFSDANAEDYQTAKGMVIYGHHIIDGPLMDQCPQMRVISNHGVGVDHIDVEAANQRNIRVGNTPGCLDASTADMTMALMLSVARNIVAGDRFARSEQFTHYDPAFMIGQEVSGAMLGIIGMGRIGQQVARRAAAFDMPVLYCNRNRRPELEASLGVQYASLDELLQQSDFVSLNCPLTPQTTGLIGERELSLMKRSAILLNLARGPVVNTDALLTALTTGEIAAAGLDVTDPEPLPRDHPLLDLENVVIAPHLGSATNRTRRRMMELTIANLDAGLNRVELPSQVSPD